MRDAHPPRFAWVVVGLLWLVALLNYLDRQLVTTMGKPVMAEFDIDNKRFGLLSTVFLIVYGVCSPLAGFASDKFGRRPVILLSLAIWSAATLATGYVNSFEEMLAARAVMGVSEAFYMPAAVALIVDFHRGRTRSRATGLHLSGTYAGAVAGGFGGMMAEAQGWRFGFQLFGIVGVLYALVLAVILPRPPAEEPAPADEPVAKPALGAALATLLTTRGFVMLLAMNALVGLAYWTLRNWVAEFFRTELHVAPEWSGVYGVSTFHAAAFVGMLFAGTASDYWSRTNPQARTLIPAFGYLVATSMFAMLGTVDVVPLLVAGVFVCGMAHGFLDANLMPATCLQVERRYWATAYGLLNLAGTTAGGLMTFVGGRLKDAQVPFGTTFLASAVFVAAASALLFAVRPKR